MAIRDPLSSKLFEELKGGLQALDDLLPASLTFIERTFDEGEKDRLPKKSEEEEVEEGGDADGEYGEQEFQEDHDGPLGAVACEDVEFQLDGLLSVINGMRNDEEEAKTLAELFESIFGEDNEIIETVAEFEDAINGYFGWLFGGEAERARDALETIIEFVDKEEEKWKNRETLFPV